MTTDVWILVVFHVVCATVIVRFFSNRGYKGIGAVLIAMASAFIIIPFIVLVTLVNLNLIARVAGLNGDPDSNPWLVPLALIASLTFIHMGLWRWGRRWAPEASQTRK